MQRAFYLIFFFAAGKTTMGMCISVVFPRIRKKYKLNTQTVLPAEIRAYTPCECVKYGIKREQEGGSAREKMAKTRYTIPFPILKSY